MSLGPGLVGSVPEETVRVARAAFPKGCLAMRVRDALGPVFADSDFADLFPVRGRPGLSPALLVMVSVLQFAESLSDRQAAEAVAGRIDWKYALGLELTDTGFDHSVLSEFRDRLVRHGAERRVLDAVLNAARDAGLLRARGRARTDSTHVLADVRHVNRLEMVGETLRAALNQIAATGGEWLAEHAEAEWFDRYGRRVESFRLPRKEEERAAWGNQVGADGLRLWELVTAADAPGTLVDLEQVEVFRRVWLQEFQFERNGQLVMRDPKDRPPGALRLVSPYDEDARSGGKRDTFWNGYKMHVTETCDEDMPRVITHVATTDATVTDFEMTAVVHDELFARELLPAEHVVDTGYVTARGINNSKERHGIIVTGPVMPEPTWQAEAAQGYTVKDFQVDWDAQIVTCPQGKASATWWNEKDRHGTPVIKIRFDGKDCRPCPVRQLCTEATRYGRSIKIRQRAEHETLIRARVEQETDEWKLRYRSRAGIEGTISQFIHTGARRSRYRTLSKTGLQHQLTAAAINFTRITAWLDGEPLATTRTSRLAALAPAA